MQYEIRPLGIWTDPVTEPRKPAHAFRASWNQTLDLLGYETWQLDAELVIFQIDVTEGDIRVRDGMLRANAKVAFPGVRVAFESRYGPLTYATDQYASWQANIRAIALALEALRAVDRYGVTKRGEQYTGWKALPAAGQKTTAQEAADLINRYGGRKEALFASHPDHGGTAEEFHAVQSALNIIKTQRI